MIVNNYPHFCDQLGEEYFDIAGVILMVILPCGGIIKINSRGRFLLGVDENATLNFLDIVPKDQQQKEKVRLADWFRNEWENKEENGVLIGANETLHFIRWRVRQLKNEKQKIFGVICSGEERTEIETLKQRLLWQGDEFRKKFRSKMLEFQNRERIELSRELHDNLGQLLTCCKLILEQENLSSTAIQSCVKYLGEAISELKILSGRLRYKKTIKQGLKKSIHQLLEKIKISGKLDVQLSFNEEVAIDSMDSVLQYNLLRVIQEHLNNVTKYAGASRLSIQIEVSEDSVDIEVQDNGAGFNRKSVSEGMGLKNICDRVEIHGGRAFFFSSPGEGCMLSICIPFY